jgi:hypothetical protein
MKIICLALLLVSSLSAYSELLIVDNVLSLTAVSALEVSTSINENVSVFEINEVISISINERSVLRSEYYKESFSPILDLRNNTDLLQTVGFDFPQYLDSSATLHLIFSSDQEKNKDICEIILLDSELDSVGKRKLMKFIDINNIESHEYDNYMTLTCKENTK